MRLTSVIVHEMHLAPWQMGALGRVAVIVCPEGASTQGKKTYHN